MSTTLTEMIGLLQEADGIGLSFGQIRKLLQLVHQKDSTRSTVHSTFQGLLENGVLADLLEAANPPSRDSFRRFLEVQRDINETKAFSCVLDCSQPFNVAAFFNDQNWSTWLGPITGDGKSGEPDHDPRHLFLSTVDFAQARFETCLEPGQIIKGEDKLLLLKQKPELIRHSGQQFQALWQDYQTNKEKSVLEWLRRTKGITYLDFMGLILRHPGGSRCVLCLYWYGGCWGWDCRWLGRGWGGRDFSVVSPASICA